jgi:hypothetical protein
MTKPELSSEQMKEELSVTLLADLQDQQQRDSTAVQSLVQKQQVKSHLFCVHHKQFCKEFINFKPTDPFLHL